MKKPKRPVWLTRTCEQCGAQWEMLASQTKHGKGRFCSRSCMGKARAPQVLKPNLKPNRTSFKAGEHMGESHPRWQPTIRFVCLNCQREFFKKPWQTRNTGAANLYCSRPCRSEHRRIALSGPNAPDWVGGPKTYRGRNWQRIRMRVVIEQCGHCAHCSRFVGKSLPVNHIKPFREFMTPEEANRRENLIGLCQPCHMRAEPRPAHRTVKASLALSDSSGQPSCSS